MRTAANRVMRQAIVLTAVTVTGLSMIAFAAEARTNQGGKYTLDYGTQLHTNPGGKYVYRGQASQFHTNPGGKYVYPGYTAAPR